MERYNNKSFVSKLVSQSSDSKVWQICDSATNFYCMFTVSMSGEVYFGIHKSKFPYAEALEYLSKLEGRKLMVTIPKKEKKYTQILDGINDCTKVPCDGVSFQIYYLNP